MTNPLWIAVRLRSALLVGLALFCASGGLTPRTAQAQARQQAQAQPQTITGTVVVRVTADTSPVSGATIATGTATGVTDRAGVARFTLPTGPHTFRVTPVGFRPESLAVFVGVGMTTVNVALHHTDKPVITNGPVAAATPAALRTSTDVPTNVEVSDRDAVEAQLDRSPGTISELLAGVGGVRVAPLSAGSAGAGIRIRGMPGRYTKILLDGLPLLGATPEGMDPLQIPALGLQRVEVTPGVTSALVGPTALSGIVNLVSAPPTSRSQVIANGSTAEASDVAIWQTHTFSPQFGATLVAGRHYQNPGDPDGDGWTEVDGYKRVVVRPRVYWSPSERSSWFMTGGWTSENRRSGTFGNKRLPDFNRFSDDADSRRADAGTIGRIQLDTNEVLTVRASLTREWRTRWFGEDRERNRRNAIFSDVALTKSLGTNVLTGGVGLERDQYAALDTRGQTFRNTTPSLFAEHTWTPDPRFGITSNARLDLHSEFGDFVSPRVAVFVRPSETWTARLSAATGVYAPTPLTDETAAFGLDPLRGTAREAEHATGWTLDLDRVSGSLELRGSAYRTVVSHPLVLRAVQGEDLELVNADEPSHTQGVDLFARYRMNPLQLTATYSYVDAVRPEIGVLVGEDFSVDTTLRRTMPLTPNHAVDLDAAFVGENNGVLGFEFHFVGRQTVSDTTLKVSRPYATFDARLEKQVGRAIVYVRGRNLTGVHQAQYSPVLRSASGPAGQWTNDVWAPLDGRVLNAGLRVRY